MKNVWQVGNVQNELNCNHNAAEHRYQGSHVHGYKLDRFRQWATVCILRSTSAEFVLTSTAFRHVILFMLDFLTVYDSTFSYAVDYRNSMFCNE